MFVANVNEGTGRKVAEMTGGEFVRSSIFRRSLRCAPHAAYAAAKGAIRSLSRTVAGHCLEKGYAMPEGVARTIAFLSSPAASYITRTNLVVDGGFRKRVQF